MWTWASWALTCWQRLATTTQVRARVCVYVRVCVRSLHACPRPRMCWRVEVGRGADSQPSCSPLPGCLPDCACPPRCTHPMQTCGAARRPALTLPAHPPTHILPTHIPPTPCRPGGTARRPGLWAVPPVAGRAHGGPVRYRGQPGRPARHAMERAGAAEVSGCVNVRARMAAEAAAHSLPVCTPGGARSHVPPPPHTGWSLATPTLLAPSSRAPALSTWCCCLLTARWRRPPPWALLTSSSTSSPLVCALTPTATLCHLQLACVLSFLPRPLARRACACLAPPPPTYPPTTHTLPPPPRIAPRRRRAQG